MIALQSGKVADADADVAGVLLAVCGEKFAAPQRGDFGPDGVVRRAGDEVGPGDDLFAKSVARGALLLEGDALVVFAGGDHQPASYWR